MNMGEKDGRSQIEILKPHKMRDFTYRRTSGTGKIPKKTKNIKW